MNQREFKENYNRHHRVVFKVILVLVKDYQTAEDLTQDTFFALHLHGLKNFKEPSKIKSWLVITATRKAYDYLKRNRKAIPVAEEFFHELGVEDNLYRKIEEEETVAALYQAIDSLPEDYKTMLILYYFDQVPQTKIAEILKIPPGTVKSRLHKARLLLKLQLGRNLQQFSP